MGTGGGNPPADTLGIRMQIVKLQGRLIGIEESIKALEQLRDGIAAEANALEALLKERAR